MFLAALDTAQSIADMNVLGFVFTLSREQTAGRWSVWVNGNWRLTFEFEAGQAYLLDYEDYH